MREVFGAVIGALVVALIGFALMAGLPVAWFSIVESSVPPEAKADFLNALFDSAWVLSISFGLGGFFGAWVFAVLGRIVQFRYVVVFSVCISCSFFLRPALILPVLLLLWLPRYHRCWEVLLACVSRITKPSGRQFSFIAACGISNRGPDGEGVP